MFWKLFNLNIVKRKYVNYDNVKTELLLLSDGYSANGDVNDNYKSLVKCFTDNYTEKVTNPKRNLSHGLVMIF